MEENTTSQDTSFQRLREAEEKVWLAARKVASIPTQTKLSFSDLLEGALELKNAIDDYDVLTMP